jgi:hypothetical protein
MRSLKCSRRSTLEAIVSEQSVSERRATTRVRWSVAALPALALTTVTVVALGWIDPSVLCLLPVLGLSLFLALRRYPGEHVLAHLAGTPRRPRARIRAASSNRGRVAVVPRGSLLIACFLAVRPPPLRPSATC